MNAELHACMQKRLGACMRLLGASMRKLLGACMRLLGAKYMETFGCKVYAFGCISDTADSLPDSR